MARSKKSLLTRSRGSASRRTRSGARFHTTSARSGRLRATAFLLHTGRQSLPMPSCRFRRTPVHTRPLWAHGMLNKPPALAGWSRFGAKRLHARTRQPYAVIQEPSPSRRGRQESASLFPIHVDVSTAYSYRRPVSSRAGVPIKSLRPSKSSMYSRHTEVDPVACRLP